MSNNHIHNVISTTGSTSYWTWNCAICKTYSLLKAYWHIDSKYLYLTIFPKLADNDSEFVAKNIGCELQTKHARKMISMEDIWQQIGILDQLFVICIGQESCLSDEKALCVNFEQIKTKRKNEKSIFLGWLFSTSFKFEGSI